ncbi:MAG: acyltransferase [Promethearchaeota archaeon]
MSVPTSMRVGPFNPTVLIKKRYLIFYIFLVWISVIPILLEFWWYWNFLYYWKPIHFFIFLPLLCFLAYITMVFTSLIFAKLLLIIVNKIHKPKEGIFLRDPSDKDYRYWNIRNIIKRWPIWLSHKFPFPFLDNLCFKMFGVKTKFSNSLFEGWVDTEFIEFGENVVVGQASHVQSTLIIGNLLIIKKTIIEDNVRIGTHAIVMPGTHIRKNCVLGSWSCTTVEQELEENWIYVGVPAHKFKKNRFFEDNLEDILGQVEEGKMTELQKKYEQIYIKRYDEHLSLKERRLVKKEKKEIEARRLKEGK